MTMKVDSSAAIANADTLFICASFFGYASEIKCHMEKRGRRVIWFDDRPSADSVSKATIRVAPWLVRKRAESYFDDIISGCRKLPIRDVFVIKGETLSPVTVKRMRAAFPRARFTLYFWDNFRNMPPDSPAKAALFDRVLTFDPQDAAANPGMVYRPLFFGDKFARIKERTRDIDVLFFGTLHGDRFRVLRRIARALPPGLLFKKILYLPAKWLFAVHALRNPDMLWAEKGDFIFKPLSQVELASLIARSRIIIDIERSVQHGYTMRTLETLGSGRKLITTGSAVLRADFYDPANIAVVERENPVVATEFLAAAHRPVKAGVLYRYSLEGWLDEVMP